MFLVPLTQIFVGPAGSGPLPPGKMELLLPGRAEGASGTQTNSQAFIFVVLLARRPSVRPSLSVSVRAVCVRRWRCLALPLSHNLEQVPPRRIVSL